MNKLNTLHALVLLFILVQPGPLLMAAESTCALCGSKEIEGAPKTPTSGIEKALAVVSTKRRATPHELDETCARFEQNEPNMYRSMIRDLDKGESRGEDYFTSAVCSPGLSSVPISVMQLVAEAPGSRGRLPEELYDFYVIQKKNPELFKKILNTKNSKGETYLDYIEFLDQREVYTTPKSQADIAKLIALACLNGAVYSKYPNKTCPSH